MELGACHVNHMLRGEDALADKAFCRETAERLSIPFYSVTIDVKTYAKEKGLSFEAAGREVRYAFFKDIMVNHNYEKCATAHHLDDQVETILLNLMRGKWPQWTHGNVFEKRGVHQAHPVSEERRALWLS